MNQSVNPYMPSNQQCVSMPIATQPLQQQPQPGMYTAQLMPVQQQQASQQVLVSGQNGFNHPIPQQQHPQSIPQQPVFYQQSSQSQPTATVSFLDQQQQMIQDNLQAVSSTTLQVGDQTVSKASPAKKLTKKQLKKLEAGEELTADDLTPKKKTPKQRKLQPKIAAKDGDESSSSQTEFVNADKNGEPEGNSCSKPMADSTQANIDATLDDLMKQYKLKGKKGKGRKDDELSSEVESDEGDESEQSPIKKGTKSRPKKPKTKQKKDDDSFDEFLAANVQEEDPTKKKRYSKKKGGVKIAQLDENGVPIEGAETAAENGVKPTEVLPTVDDIVCHLKAPVLPMIVQKATSGRRKNLNLAKLMKKNGRKRKKKTSSGEEEDDEDDSDEGFEVPVTKRGGKKANNTGGESMATDEATMDTDAQNDENTAKALQVYFLFFKCKCVGYCLDYQKLNY